MALAEVKLEAHPLDVFLRETCSRIKEDNHRCVLVIGLTKDDGKYHHTLRTENLTSSECVALLEITKQAIIGGMDVNY